MRTKCIVCKKIFNTRPHRLKKGEGKYCSIKCMAKDYKIRLKGKNNPFYGKKHKKETKVEQGKVIKEKWKQPGYKENQIEKSKGQRRSPKTEFKKGHIPKNPFKKGLIPWNKNTKGIVKAWNKGKKNPQLRKRNLKNWEDPTYRNKMSSDEMLKRRFKGMHMRPNKPETIMIKIIKENNLPFNYVGDGQIIIGGFNPDFLSKNPKHIIEVNGDYWHNLPKVKEKDKRKLKTYSKYGYKTLTIWEHELKNPNQVLNRIEKFK